MDTFESLMFGALMETNNRNEVIGRDTINNYTIDTCYTIDQGWETAVWYMNYPMIIVARYPSKELAEQGHNNWIETCTTNMPTHAYSVQTECIESFIGD